MQTVTAIQDEVLGLQLDKDYFVTALDNQSVLYVDIDQGTNVTYTVFIDDTTSTVYSLYHNSDNLDVPGEHDGRFSATSLMSIMVVMCC